MDQATRKGAQETVERGVFRDLDYRDQADFRCALRQFLHFSEEQARLAGITPQQHLLLLMVRGHRSYPSVSIGEVAQALQIRHHGASLLVDRSVRRGLLNRREDPMDRRRALVSWTDEGQRILDRITEANRRELGALEGVLFRDSFRQALQAYADLGIRSAKKEEFAG
jgi:DNA-binding MarR family transcriptional regulator